MPAKKIKYKYKKSKKEKKRRMDLLDDFKSTWKDEELLDDKDKKIVRDNVGRPTVMTKQCVIKLEEAFSIGCSDLEACVYAGISRNCFYEYLKKKPEFNDRIEELRESTVLLARGNVMNAIKRESQKGIAQPFNSWEFLKRKKKQEFSDQKNIKIEKEMTAKELEELGADEMISDED